MQNAGMNLAVEVQNLNHWPAREVPLAMLLVGGGTPTLSNCILLFHPLQRGHCPHHSTMVPGGASQCQRSPTAKYKLLFSL